MNNEAAENGVAVTGGMVESMRSIKPWTKLLAVLGFIAVGFMVLLGVGVTVFARMLQTQKGAPTAFLGLFYIVISVFYFIPALYLYRYSSAIGRFLEGYGVADLEAAFSHQKSFWKFTGITALIGIIIGLLGIVAAVAIPMLTRMRM
ncbi:MAG: hypothetical protein OEW15_04820 [Nitrospirota bacterium]|nr:hypothetical protein [Nitrospirota bacterium]